MASLPASQGFGHAMAFVSRRRRERLGLPSACLLCPNEARESLQHTFYECPSVKQSWAFLCNTMNITGLPPAQHNWKEISRGPMTEPPGRSVEEKFRWDTATTFSLNANPCGIFSKPNYFGPYGASAYHMPSTMNNSIWEWCFGMPRAIQ